MAKIGSSDAGSESTPIVRTLGVATLNMLWGLVVPVSAAGFLGWQRFSATSLGELQVHWDWVLWLVPFGLLLAGWTTLGLYLRENWGRRASLALAGTAIAVNAAHLEAALVAPERLSPVIPILMIAFFAWPLWHLNRPDVRKAFEA